MYLYNENVDHYDGFLLQNMVYQWYKEKGDFLGCLGTNLGPPSSFSQACSKVIRLEMLQCLHFSFDFCKPVKFFYLGKLKKTFFLQEKSLDFLMTHFLIYFSEANEVLENLVSKLLLKSNLLVKSFSFSPYFIGRQNRDFRHLLGR